MEHKKLQASNMKQKHHNNTSKGVRATRAGSSEAIPELCVRNRLKCKVLSVAKH